MSKSKLAKATKLNRVYAVPKPKKDGSVRYDLYMNR